MWLLFSEIEPYDWWSVVKLVIGAILGGGGWKLLTLYREWEKEKRQEAQQKENEHTKDLREDRNYEFLRREEAEHARLEDKQRQIEDLKASIDRRDSELRVAIQHRDDAYKELMRQYIKTLTDNAAMKAILSGRKGESGDK